MAKSLIRWDPTSKMISLRATMDRLFSKSFIQPWFGRGPFLEQAIRSYLRWVWSLIRSFFSAPFRDLPPAFGDTVPPELRAYAAEVDEIQHRVVGMVSLSNGRGHVRSKPRH